MVEFVSYDGKWPCLCGGELTVRIDGEAVNLGRCLATGGFASFTDDWEETVGNGPWTVSVPEGYALYEAEITRLVNANVPWGCCGGCI